MDMPRNLPTRIGKIPQAATNHEETKSTKKDGGIEKMRERLGCHTMLLRPSFSPSFFVLFVLRALRFFVVKTFLKFGPFDLK